MKLGFDIDDTLINLREHAFCIYNQKLKKNVSLDTFHNLKTLEIHGIFDLSREEGSQMWRSLQEEIYYSSCPPFPSAVEALQKLDQQGHEIYYITARAAEHRERTIQWLKQNGFPLQEERFYCGMDDLEKVDIIRDLQLDYYFDDKPRVLETLLDLSVQVYAKDHPYNKHLSIPRIVHWNELEEIIDQGI